MSRVTGTIIPNANQAAANTQPAKPRLIDSRHPEYTLHEVDWLQWRLTYKAGRKFLEKYLERYTLREGILDFENRKKITPIPAFAKAAINDIKNSIFQRMGDTTRIGGPENYQEAIKGNNGGIDRRGGSMNWFIGDQILAELLTMKKVGVFVDSPPLRAGETQASRSTAHPYLYRYQTEDILNWAYKTDGSQMELQAVLLRDYENSVDSITKLPVATVERFRLMWIGADNKVHIQFFDTEDKKVGSETALQLSKIPFVVFEISDSLLSDAASYQIALLNLKSTDVSFAHKSNFPFYTEQHNPNTESLFAKQPAPSAPSLAILPNDPTTLVPFDPTASCYPQGNHNNTEIDIGIAHGRRYDSGTDRPEFIHPSPEPLKVSLELQNQLKEDIRLLINLALSNMSPKMASAESKAMDQTGLESGLSYIGLELEHGERQIAVLWGLYETSDPATIKYPERYSLKTDEQQQTEATGLKKQIFTAASPTFQREMVKRIAIILLGSKVSAEKLSKILTEIENSDVISADPDLLTQHLTDALVSVATASKAAGYKPNEAATAKQDHLQRLIEISKAQGIGKPQGPPTDPAAQGVADLSANPKAPAQQKQGLPQRGPAAGNTLGA